MDLLVSPEKGTSTSWTVYNSKGNGQFEKSIFTGPARSISEDSRFIIEDLNADGETDMIKYNDTSFDTYICRNNQLIKNTLSNNCPHTKPIFIPSNINSHNSFTQLLCLKDSIITKLTYYKNENLRSMIIGMANSLGVVEKNVFSLINEENMANGLYTKGYDAPYPYVNIQDPLAVLASSESYINGSKINNSTYRYNNAVLHKQGLGFRGFEQVTVTNNRGQDLIRTYEPYRYSLLQSEVSPFASTNYVYTVNIEGNKVAKIRILSKIQDDLLKGINTTTTYTYDNYGYPTQEFTRYSDGITIKKVNLYSQKATVEDGYNLGFLYNQIITTTRGDKSHTERMYMLAFYLRQPQVIVNYRDGNQVKQTNYSYDSHGNQTSETVKFYTSSNLQKTLFEYDIFGRITKVTNPMGLSNMYTYNSAGLLDTVTDYRGGITTYKYDNFGRKISITNPDHTIENIKYTWNSSGTNGMYAITNTTKGVPTTTIVYDPINRDVRSCVTLSNGSIKKIDKLYDSYGNLLKESLPFITNAPANWCNYVYDEYNRLLSYSEPSGKKILYSYNKNNITTIENKISITRKYDSLGNIISATDPTGTITYNLDADGQNISVVAPGNITTTFEYDKYRRQTSLSDPSQGTTTYTYDSAGNIIAELNANGNETTMVYDSFNRLIKTSVPEFETTYTYSPYNELTAITNNNGTSTSFVYDIYGRLNTWKETGLDGKFLQKNFSYRDGNIYSIKYTSDRGELGTEQYVYSNGHLNDISFNHTIIYRLTKENYFGNPTEITSGNMTRKYDYTSYGLPSGRSVYSPSKTYQNLSYIFDPTTTNLTSRSDNTRKFTENFGYDNLNRLNTHGDNTVSYDIKGNITSKSEIGSFDYSLTNKPYAITTATITGKGIPLHNQSVTYTSFGRPLSISENRYDAQFFYNSQYDRVKTIFKQNGGTSLIRHYLGGCYEFDYNSSTSMEKLYLGGENYYDATAVYVKDRASSGFYYLLRDYLGSLTHIISSDGTIIQELSYDAWGRLRDPSTQKVYEPGFEPVLFLGRGYTGHEHLTKFGLINMNARLYDPALGRFLSPDPLVQAPDLSQNFNRYTYALNNPLCYIDENGEFVWAPVIIGAVIGAGVNVLTHLNAIKSAGNGWQMLWKGAQYALAGGLAGGAGVIAGMWGAVGFAHIASATSAGLSLYTMGFAAGSYAGAAGGAAGGFILDTSNALIDGKRFDEALADGIFGATTGAFLGGLTGGIGGGVKALRNGRDFWTGRYTNRGLIQKTADMAERAIGGKGRFAGSAKHRFCKSRLQRYQTMIEDRNLKLEEKIRHSNGKILIPDVFDKTNLIIYDYKFGYPSMTPTDLYYKFLNKLTLYQEVTNATKSIIIKPFY